MVTRFLATLALLGSLLAPTAHAVTLIYSNDADGEIEPCGCHADPKGGFARKLNLMNSLHADDFLVLDAGNLFFGSETIAPVLADQTLLQAQTVAEASNKTHQDAFTPGPKDFALGLNTLLKLKSKSHFKFLSANLQSGGKNIFEPYALFAKKSAGKKLKIAVLGLSGDTLIWPKDLKVTPAIEAAQHWVPILRKKADLVIALTHEGFLADQKLAEAVSGIDLIVGGESMDFLIDPKKAGSTLIVQSSYRNQYLGVFPLQVPLDPTAHKLVPLNDNLDTPHNGLHVLAENLKKKIQAFEEKENLATRVPPVKTVYQTLPRCAGCHMKQFDFWRKTPHAQAYETLFAKNEVFNKECLSCHSIGLGKKSGYSSPLRIAEFGTADDPHSEWIEPKTLASIFKTLRETPTLDTEIKLQPTDAEASPLRTQMGRFRHVWADVQCEHCHGEGHNHPFDQTPMKVAKEVCLTCHTPVRAPAWYGLDHKPLWDQIEQKRSLMTCPSGD